MLNTPVGIVSPSSSGGGVYNFSLFFQSGGTAVFVRVGDTVKDTIGNEYSITSWVGFPSDFTSGSVVLTTFITNDTLPVADAGFTSTAFTPGQADVRPAVQTPGTIISANLFSGQTLEYTTSASWTINSEALAAVVGDRIADASGKEFEITFLDTGQFNDPFRMKEVIAEGSSPIIGAASLYRATVNEAYFQGTELNDPGRTNIFNRDKFTIDAKFKELEDSIVAGNSGEAVIIILKNGSGSTLSKLTPVRSDSAGELNTIDPSVEVEATAIIGIVQNSINIASQGPIVAHGRLQDITTTAILGDSVFLSKTGTVTSTKPSIGVGGFVAGDFVIKIGVISKNLLDGLKKDLDINLEIVGQL